MKQHPIVVIGGGYAGLLAARQLASAQIPFTLYEASKNVAGLASTFKDVEGYSYDFGTHLITNRLAQTLGIEARCRDVEYFGESVVLGGKVYSYPFGLVAVPKFSLSALKQRLSGSPAAAALDAAAWTEATLGPELAREVAIPLMEKLTGVPATELSPAISNKLPNVLQTVMLRIAG
ncbi:MAG: NAD(P)-binding protein, partial [Gammaproteobacteria bacterium]